jgi:hypothetical protein
MKTWVTGVCVALVAALASSAAAQAPTQDSVAGTLTRGGGERDTIIWSLNARSGPSGEDPAGTIDTLGILLRASFPVTCLQVTGNRAVIGGRLTTGATVVRVYLIVIDEPGATQDRVLDRFFINDPAAPTTCAAFDAQVGGTIPPPAASGSVIVTDAQPFPTAKDQCRNDGWKTYGVFKNQGDCVSFVRHQARQACIFERVAHGIVAFRAKYGLAPDQNHAMRHCVRLYTGW